MTMNLLRNRPARIVIRDDFDGDIESATETATVLARTVAPSRCPDWVYDLSTERPGSGVGSRHIRSKTINRY